MLSLETTRLDHTTPASHAPICTFHIHTSTGPPSPAKPMNMADWNSQQRAQKEQERKNKAHAADNLRNHRGGVKEDDTKLAAMRADERKQQQDAASMLHSYRGAADDVESKARPVRQDPVHPPPENNVSVEEVQIAPGSVSAMAEQFSSSGTPVKEQKESVVIPQDAVKNIAGAFDMEEKKTEDAPAAVSVVEPPVPEPVVVQEPQVESSTIPEPEPVAAPVVAIVEKEPVVQSAVIAAESNKDEPLNSKGRELNSKPVRLDVLFSFGLVTKKSEPSFSGYLDATQDIVKATLLQNAALAERVSYDATYGPYVKDCVVDGEYRRCCRSLLRLDVLCVTAVSVV